MSNGLTPQGINLTMAQVHVSTALDALRQAKSEDRTPKDRAVAIGITDLEKVLAWLYYVEATYDE